MSDTSAATNGHMCHMNSSRGLMNARGKAQHMYILKKIHHTVIDYICDLRTFLQGGCEPILIFGLELSDKLLQVAAVCLQHRSHLLQEELSEWLSMIVREQGLPTPNDFDKHIRDLWKISIVLADDPSIIRQQELVQQLVLLPSFIFIIIQWQTVQPKGGQLHALGASSQAFVVVQDVAKGTHSIVTSLLPLLLLGVCINCLEDNRQKVCMVLHIHLQQFDTIGLLTFPSSSSSNSRAQQYASAIAPTCKSVDM